MSKEQEDSKTVRVPTFNGEKGLFQTWWIRFRAYAKVAGFIKALETTPENDLPGNQIEADALTGNDDDTKKKLAAVKRNDAAMANLTLAFTSDELIALILTSQTSDWPEGLASEVVKELIKKYKPDDIMSLVDEKVALNKIRMSSNEEPKQLFERIKAVEVQYNTKTKKISEPDKIAVVLSQAPSMYKSVITAEQRLKRGLGIDVTMQDLREVMDEHYRLISGENEDNAEETALYYKSGNAANTRNDQGGTRNRNYEKNRNSRNYKRNGKRFTGTCNICGKQYHKAKDCWQNDKNAARRPSWWKKGARNIETNAVGMDGPPEIVLANMDYCYETDDEMNTVTPPRMIKYEDGWSSDDDSSTPPPPLICRVHGDSSDEESLSSNDEYELPLPLDGRTWGSLCDSDDDSIRPNEAYYVNKCKKSKLHMIKDDLSECTSNMPELEQRGEDSISTENETMSNLMEWDDAAIASEVSDEPENKASNEPKSVAPNEERDKHETETILPNFEIPSDFKILLSPEIWIADTGATVHNTPHEQGIENKKQPSATDHVTVGNGQKMQPATVGDIKGTITSKEGVALMNVTLKNVLHTPTSQYNLLSVTKLMSEGWKLSGDSNRMAMKKKNNEINFDIIIRTKRGKLFCVNIQRASELGLTSIIMNKAKAHNILGHAGDDATMKTAKALGWKLVGPNKPCESCQMAKAKQKAVPKCSTHVPSNKPGERLFLDISIIKKPKELKYIGKPNWLMIVDEKSKLKFSKFCKTKKEIVEPSCVLINKFREMNIATKYIRCDNAGENQSLEKTINGANWRMNIQFEYTARATPQQNSLVETSFNYILNKGRALMIEANVPYLTRYKIVQEALLTATKLDGLVVDKNENKTRYEVFGLGIPKFAKHLRTWGEAGVVKVHEKMNPKLSNKGLTCAFVGYADNHEGDCYRMWDPKQHYIYITRDIIWLKRMYFPQPPEPPSYEQVIELPDVTAGESVDQQQAATAVASPTPETSPHTTPMSQAPHATPINQPTPAKLKVTVGGTEIIPNDENDDESFQEITRSRSGRTIHPRKFYHEEYQAVCTDEENYYSILDSDDDEDENIFYEIKSELASVGAGLGGGYDHSSELKPMNYREAMASSDKEEWLKEIDKENERMKKYNVWEPVPKSEVPADIEPLTSTWAFKKKSTGNRRGRLNAHGFKQKEGKHYKKDSISSPVTNEVTIRIVLVIILVLRLLAGVLDVKGAFLQGEFDKDEADIYMHVPDGLEDHYGDNVLLKLLAPIYGLKNASMAFYKKLKRCMNKIGCTRSLADPCLYFTWATNLVIWLSWIDDCMYCGKPEDVKQCKTKLMSELDCEDSGELNEYVGVKIERKGDRMKLTQPVLVQSIEDEFLIPDKTPCTLPAPHGSDLTSEGEPLNEDEKKVFRSGVGKLLFLMRYSRPDILNAVRELSKWMSDGATVNHQKVMHQTMNYILHTRNRGLHLNPIMSMVDARKEEFIIKGRGDSNYATNAETRKSTSGIEVTLNGAPIVMRSVGQKIVALSTTEAELIALAMVVQEMLYVMRILESMHLKVQKPMIVECDNKGAVDLCNSWTVGGRTKHIDTRYYFLRELKEEGVIAFRWISGKINSADLFTKNLPNPLFTKHAGYYCTDEDFSVEE